MACWFFAACSPFFCLSLTGHPRGAPLVDHHYWLRLILLPDRNKTPWRLSLLYIYAAVWWRRHIRRMGEWVSGLAGIISDSRSRLCAKRLSFAVCYSVLLSDGGRCWFERLYSSQIPLFCRRISVRRRGVWRTFCWKRDRRPVDAFAALSIACMPADFSNVGITLATGTCCWCLRHQQSVC